MHKIIFTYNGSICFNLFSIPIVLEHLLKKISVCFFQFKLLSIVKPKKLSSSIFSITILSILRINVCVVLCDIWKVIYLDLRLFSESFLISGKLAKRAEVEKTSRTQEKGKATAEMGGLHKE